MTSWIVMANSSFAEIFSQKGTQIQKVDKIDFKDGRLKARDIYSDKPGRGFESMGNGTRHALSSELDFHQHEQQIFAHKLADFLRKAKAENAYEHLILIAPPEFLGELRPVLPDAVRKSVSKEFKKDFPTSLTEQERLDHLYKLLDLKRPSTPSAWT